MVTITIRHIPDEVHRVIKARAARHGRGIDAEIRDILSTALAPAYEGLGDLLANLGARAGGITLDPCRDAAESRALDLS